MTHCTSSSDTTGSSIDNGDTNDDNIFTLWGEPLLRVCMAIAEDAEPLHTFTERMRSLCAISECCREAKAVVRGNAFPALSKRFGVDAVTERPIPTVENLVRRSEGELSKLEAFFCTSPSMSRSNAYEHRNRSTRVDALLRLAECDGALWKLVPLKRKMRHLRDRMVQCQRDALFLYRLRPEDLAGKHPPFSREDLATIALRRHGSHAAMLARDASIRELSRKRAETISIRGDRREDMYATLRSIAECATKLHQCSRNAASDDYNHVFQRHSGMAAAVDRYVVKGTPAFREKAVDLFRSALDSLHVRRAQARSLPWPPADLVPSALAESKKSYVDRGRLEDLADASRLSDVWTTALAILAGESTSSASSESLVELSNLVSQKVRTFVNASFSGSSADVASASAALTAVSNAYSRIALPSEEVIKRHPRAKRIMRMLPAAIASELPARLGVAAGVAGDAAGVAGDRIAMIATKLAETAFCDYHWTTHIAPKLPSRIFSLDRTETIRSFALDRMRKSFANPDERCDWADVAASVLDRWSLGDTINQPRTRDGMHPTSCTRCHINVRSQNCDKQMCRACCLLPPSQPTPSNSSCCSYHVPQ